MPNDVIFALRFAATIGCGLMAGLFFAFSLSVMPGLRQRPSAEGMVAMQAINQAILNPIFLGVFLATALLSLAVLVTALMQWSEAAAYCATGAAAYLGGGLLVTMAINVPMNNALARTTPTHPDAARLWDQYLTRWTMWNHVRLVASLAAAIALIFGMSDARFT
jgi:uncharacterized membrane protein